MKILLMGGTGAMGVSLIRLLEKTNNKVVVTSRQKHESYSNIEYLKGNAHSLDFLQSTLEYGFDVIVDFMVYDSAEFEKRKNLLLSNCKQYIFLSSARVFAESDNPIIETSPRLVDVCTDKNYLSTDEYALAKARQENLLISSKSQNWTIVRPYITYNTNRLQLGVYEKEDWLWRALNNQSVVIPKDILEKRTTLTYGEDVAYALFEIIGNDKCQGEIYNIINNQSIKWREVLELYLRVIEEKQGAKIRIKEINNIELLKNTWNRAQIQYDRMYDRIFDNTKISKLCPQLKFEDEEKLKECLISFLEKPKWLNINWKHEAWADKQQHTLKTIIKIPGLKTKLKYLKWRFLY